MRFCAKYGLCILLCCGILILIVGLITATCFRLLLVLAVHYRYSLFATSESYIFLEKTAPITFLHVFPFNWTNADEVYATKWGVKPAFTRKMELIFSEHYIRSNIKWNKNGTVSYRLKRIWKFMPKISTGKLSDTITNFNLYLAMLTPVLSFAYPEVVPAVCDSLNKNNITFHSSIRVGDALFDGYTDDNLLSKLGFTFSDFQLPEELKRFGWFLSRNNSETFDGTYTIYTGETDIHLLGTVNLWNGRSHMTNKINNCTIIKGTSSELWPPSKYLKYIYIFILDLCSSIRLEYEGVVVVKGVIGRKYVTTDYTFGNGQRYRELDCFRSYVDTEGRFLPIGVRDISRCNIHFAQTFASNPHFYLAHKKYLKIVNITQPTKIRDQSYVIIEPITGIPLGLRIRIQYNLYVRSLKNSDCLLNLVKETFVPIMTYSKVQRVPSERTLRKLRMIQALLTTDYTGIKIAWAVVGIGALIIIFSICCIDRNRKQDLYSLLLERAAANNQN